MGDDVRTDAAVRFLAEDPDFMAVHLLKLDSAQHGAGPFSDKAKAVLEIVDEFGNLVDDGRKNPKTIVFIQD